MYGRMYVCMYVSVALGRARGLGFLVSEGFRVCRVEILGCWVWALRV